MVQVVEEWFDYLIHRTTTDEGLTPLSRERIVAIASEHIPHAQRYAPDLFTELHGIAEGARIALGDLFVLNCFLDLYEWLSPTWVAERGWQPVNVGGCTTFGVSGAAAQGDVFIGQNYDLASLFQPAAVLIRVRSDDAPSMLFYTTAGTLGHVGMNAAGVGVVINNLQTLDARPGVPYPFIIRKVMAAERIGDAIDAVLLARRASGMNFLIADGSGELIDLETSATDYDVIYGWGGIVAHANHFVCEKMKPYEARWLGERGQTMVRYSRMNKLLRAGDGRRTLEDLQRILCDHANHPIALCRHDEPTAHGSCGKTICGVIFNPAQRRAWFSAGNPCEVGFQEYHVE
jgi:isopenicillin-N N-acyltransferase-like protein